MWRMPRAKTAENLVPASPEQSAALEALFQSQATPEAPLLLADDEEQWAKVWSRLKRQRRDRLVLELTGLGIETTGLKTRAEMVLKRDGRVGE